MSYGEGQRTHKHGYAEHKVHDEHVKHMAHGDTHLSHAVDFLRDNTGPRDKADVKAPAMDGKKVKGSKMRTPC